LYAVTAAYFAGVMVRLMLTFTPVVCVLAGIAFSNIFEKYMFDESSCKRDDSVANKEDRRLYDKASNKKPRLTVPSAEIEDVGMNTRTVVSLALMFILLMYVAHCTYVTSNAYSHPSVVLQSHANDGSRVIMDDFREAYYWLRQNTAEVCFKRKLD
jgi:dolichyl-diphosphooligosaccharide--protein glycosyltransferase